MQQCPQSSLASKTTKDELQAAEISRGWRNRWKTNSTDRWNLTGCLFKQFFQVMPGLWIYSGAKLNINSLCESNIVRRCRSLHLVRRRAFNHWMELARVQMQTHGCAHLQPHARISHVVGTARANLNHQNTNQVTWMLDWICWMRPKSSFSTSLINFTMCMFGASVIANAHASANTTATWNSCNGGGIDW